MKLEVNLDDKWINDYDESIAQVIKQEIDQAVRNEVRKVVGAAVKKQMAGMTTMLEKAIKQATPAKIAKVLEALEKP